MAILDSLSFRRLVDVSSAAKQSVMVASDCALITWHHHIAINAVANGAVTITPHGGPI